MAFPLEKFSFTRVSAHTFLVSRNSKRPPYLPVPVLVLVWGQDDFPRQIRQSRARCVGCAGSTYT